jgi:hypothetical protein
MDAMLSVDHTTGTDLKAGTTMSNSRIFVGPHGTCELPGEHKHDEADFLPPLAAVLVEWSRIENQNTNRDDIPPATAILRNGMRVESSWWEAHTIGGRTFLVTTDENVGMEVLDPAEIIFVAPTSASEIETKLINR